jgi:signal transduction histidine kinase
VRSAPVAFLDTWGVRVEPSSAGGTLTICNFTSDDVLGSSGLPAARGSTSCTTFPPKAAWENTALAAKKLGAFTAAFDATPSPRMEAMVGISPGRQTNRLAYPIMVRFTTSGLIQAHSGGSYIGALHYLGGQRYHFRLAVDLASHTYSIFVTPPQSAEQALGTNLAFRSARNLTLVVAMSTKDAEASLVRFRQLIVFLLASNLILVGLVSSFYVRRSLRPLSDLTERVGVIALHLRGGASVQAPLAEVLRRPLPLSNSQDELGRLTDAFNQLSATLHDVLQQLQQFVSDASHELRTPLSILRGEAELLLRKPHSVEEYRQVLTVINTELKNLGRIVEGLFTLAMADAGQLRICKQPLCLNDVLEEACVLMGRRAQEKSIAIKRRHVEKVLSAGDEILLRELFLIFLDNALKYSPPHTFIQVDVKSSGNMALAVFEDRGMGIAAEHLPHIFERFYRVPTSGNEDTQSGGLGLAIAKAIAEVHGGSIECASTPGKGSIFTVQLPRSTTDESADLAAKPESIRET